jgi:hypothetical protein
MLPMKNQSRATSLTVAITLISALVLAGPVANAQSASSDSWEFSVTPYMWFVQLDGSAGVKSPPLPTADVNVPFYEVWDNLNIALMGLVEARKGRFGLWTDPFYAQLEDKKTGGGPANATVKVELNEFLMGAGASYRVLEDATSSLDLTVGLRLWSVDAKLKTSSDIPEINGSRSGSQTWEDPLVGVIVRSRLTDNFSVVGWWMVGGGLSNGSDNFWDAMAAVNYQFTKTISANVGYRYLSDDYNNDGVVFDVVQKGPLVGVTFRF